MQSRRTSRRIAIQILFCNEFLREPIESVALRTTQSLNEELTQFTGKLIRSTTENEDELNVLIRAHLRNWDFNRIPFMDRVLIRIGLSEMLYFKEIPVQVTINEVLEISKDFCNLKSRRFVNGMLDTIYRELDKAGRLNKNPHVYIAMQQKNNKKPLPNPPHLDIPK